MKPICPCCHSSAVYEVSDNTDISLFDELLSPAVLVGLGVSICKTLKVHPAIGAVVGIVLATVIELTQPNKALPMRVNKQYRCSSCDHVFTDFN
ncbi:hypothetical protein ES754_11265 [Psychrobacter frigidicola]|uniref:Uncharacterized protein n=1 Tax=Psychrobacter frigidicola TaxID=45611 RepID=A0A5C6ZYU8_9GAMM|nr:hypothetical protein [Psychrobacter frigidicola]TXD96207.1 hypothetical protein ES754_11265 [Psychrobacter frigidicola]